MVVPVVINCPCVALSSTFGSESEDRIAGARREAGPAARREKCFKLPIRSNPDFPSEHLAHQVFGLFGGSADAFDRFYQGRAVQAKRAETVGQS